MPVDLTDGLLAGMRAAPSLDPEMVYGAAASSDDPGQVAETSQAIEAFGSSVKFKSYLSDQDGDVQRTIWASLDGTTRRMLKSAGYKTPEPKKPGFLEKAFEKGGGGISNFDNMVQGAVSSTLHGAGAPLRALQHAYRAAALAADEEVVDGNSKWGADAWGNVFSPGTWARTWRETEHGEQTFSPLVLRDVTKRFDPDVVEIAKELAAGVRLEELTADLDPEAAEALFKRADTEEVNDVRQILEDGKLSFGRRLAHTTGLDPNSEPFEKVSGISDGLFDWFGDPLVVGGKAAKGVQVSRYLVRDAEDVARLAQKPTVQRWINDVSDRLATGDAASLMERYPRSAYAVEQLVKDKVKTPEQLTEWLQGAAGVQSLLTGRVSGFATSAPTMPMLTRVGRVRLEAKGALKKTIDFMADTPARIAADPGPDGILRFDDALSVGERLQTSILTPVGSFARKFTTLIPRAIDFDPSHPDAVVTIQRLAAQVLPAQRSREIVNLWTAAPDLGAKRQIYKGLLSEMFRAAGLDSNVATKQWAERFVQTLDNGIAKRLYSSGGIDRVNMNGQSVAAGILEGQLTETWGLPSFRALWANSKRANMVHAVFGKINHDTVDRFMTSTWKPLTLLRLGFAPRAGGEELFTAIMREGPRGVIKARAAWSGVIKGEVQANDALLPFHPLHRIWNRYTFGLSDDVKAKIQKPVDFVGEVFGDRARRAFRNVEKKMAGDDYVTGARELYENGVLDDAFRREITGVDGRAAGYLTDPEELTHLTRNGNRVHGIAFRSEGDYKEYLPVDNQYLQIWHRNLEEITNSPMARLALEHADDRQAAVAAIADHIESPAFAKMRARSVRARFTRDGGQVDVDVTSRDAAEDWANTIIDHVDSLVRDSDGQIIGNLPGDLMANDIPTLGSLNDVPDIRRPQSVRGKEVIPVHRSPIQGIIEKGFDEIVGRPIDWMVRQPLFLHNYVLAKKEVAGLRKLLPEVNGRIIDTVDVLSLPEGKIVPYAGKNDTISFFNMNHFIGGGDPAIVPGVEGELAARLDDIDEQYIAARIGKAITEVRHPGDDIAKVMAEAEEGGVAAERLSVAADAARESLNDAMERGYRVFLDSWKDGDKLQHWQELTSPSDLLKIDPKEFFEDSIVLVPGASAKTYIRTQGHPSEQMMREVAVERAIAKTLTGIDDPRVRSQFSVITRNLFPFWHAQEQFYKRMAMTLKHSPAAFRQVQLMMMGLRHSGFIQTDNEGNDFFIYPFADTAQDVLTTAFEKMTGKKASIPMPVGFSGKVQFVTPGLDRLGIPSAGPLAALPIRALSRRFPELQSLENAALGERGAGRPYWEMITPTTITRTVRILAARPDTDAQMTSAMMQAAQYLEATGHGLRDDATSTEIGAYTDRLTNWARILLLNRTIFGYSVPAAPELELDPSDLNEEFREMLGAMPIEQAIGEFIRRNPDATAYTVFQSKSQSGGPLPATKSTMKVLDSHREFFDAYPNAAAWFLPQSPDDDDFSVEAYREQLALELRKKKDFNEFYRDIKYAKAADTYFDSRDAKDAALEKAEGPKAANIRAAWDRWKTEYLAMHPIFAEELSSLDGPKRRAATLDQLRLAVDDERVPKSPQLQHVRTMVEGYDSLQAALDKTAGLRTTKAINFRKRVKAAFITWADDYIAENPDVKGLYDRVIRLEVED